MQFTYEGMVRYGFGFANPNHAAALIVMLIVTLWTIRLETGNGGANHWFCVFELILCAALFYTYSRAGTLALAVSAVLFWGLRYSVLPPGTGAARRKKYILPYVLYGAIILSVYFYSGISRRNLNSFILPDKAIGNRFEIWRGGLKMLADMPLGTGTALSGRIYTLFYLPAASSLGYRTLINSFLTFLVEQGILISGLLLFGMLFTAAASGRLLRNPEIGRFPKQLMIGCLAAIAAGLVCGMLSTCFDISLGLDSTNNVLQGLTFIFWLNGFIMLMVVEIYYYRFVPVKRLSVQTGLGLAGLIIIGLLYCSFISRDRTRFSCPGPGLVATRTDSANVNVLIVPDFNLNLKDQFHTVAEYFRKGKLTFVVSEDMKLKNLLKRQQFDIIVLYGASCSMANTLEIFAARMVLFCPRVFDLAHKVYRNNIARIYLKHDDEKGNNFFWENYPGGPAKTVYIKASSPEFVAYMDSD